MKKYWPLLIPVAIAIAIFIGLVLFVNSLEN